MKEREELITSAEVEKWRTLYGCKVYEPASADLLQEAVIRLGSLPPDLLSLYRITNGLTLEWFEVLPIEDRANIKRTWNGLLRANDPKKTQFLSGDKSLLERFLVFASLGSSTCAVYDRLGKSIWYEEHEHLNETDLDLVASIETCLREVKEL